MLALKLVEEHKISKLLPECDVDDRLEASGVLAKDGHFYVIFDNLTQVARIKSELPLNSEHNVKNNVFLGERNEDTGFEDITYSDEAQRFYLLIEALPHDEGGYKSKIEEYDDDFNLLASHWVDYKFKNGNKGFEGLVCWRRDRNEYLLALCEGNKCKGGKKGKKPGGGRIQVFQKAPEHWAHVGTIRIPKAVQFEDYSSVAINDDKVAIVSQASSKLWVGTWWDFVVDEGTTYEFPKESDGKIVYGNVEGVSWIAPDRIVVVSDRRKREQSKRYRKKDQSIHIFEIPGHGG